MKNSVMALCAGLGSLVLLSVPLRAGFEGIEVEVKPNDLGLLTFSVYAVFGNPGLDHLNAVAGTPDSPLGIFVKHGSLYQNAFGSDRPPLDALVQTFPSLAYDSFVTIGVKSIGPPNGQPADNMILTPGWPGFVSCSLNGDNMGWAVIPVDPQGDPFDPVHSFPGDGRILIGQFSTADGDGVTGAVNIQMISDGLPILQTVSFEHQVGAPATGACSAGGPGPHWVDCCAGGLDAIVAEATIGIDTLDGQPVAAFKLLGTAQIQRSNPGDDSFSFPDSALHDDHLDVIDTEIVAMQLQGPAGTSLVAGANQGQGGNLPASLGVIVELGDTVGASKLIQVFVEIDTGSGPLLYNHQPLLLQAQVTCAPAQVTCIYLGPAIALFTSPIPGQGAHLADLVPRLFRFGVPAPVAVALPKAAE